MQLKKLLQNINCNLKNIKNVKIKGVSCNSKAVKPGYLFIAARGSNTDGHDFISDAMRKKAAVVIGELPLKNIPGYIKVASSRKAMAIVADNFYNHAAGNLKIIGITGTNGKTTTSFLVQSIIHAAANSAALIGTISYFVGTNQYPAPNTTPDALSLHALFARMVKKKNDYCVMEVSSHALDQGRVYNIDFKVGVFTNLTRDHLDYHKNFENYFNAKKILFKSLAKSAYAVINIDDYYGKKMQKVTKANVLTYGFSKDADIYPLEKKYDRHGLDFYLNTPKGICYINTPLIGEHNIYNIMAAVATGIALGFSLNVIKKGIEAVTSVPGRLEQINAGQKFGVFIDYAHTDDALKNVLSCIKNICPRRLIVVFGCGGNRDRTKRPLMGKVATNLADFSIITNDNPRNENPQDIASDILKGIAEKKRTKYKVILDRYQAIRYALLRACPNDVVVIAGKGHENKQIIGNKIFAFDDCKTAREILKGNEFDRK